jgi:flagellar motor switch/type III secretory pathway protein FliN
MAGHSGGPADLADPVRSVAGWEPGSLVPVSFQAGQEMELLVNGKRLASGRLVESPNGALSVEILAVFPATAEAG